jgi:hypothetical protein
MSAQDTTRFPRIWDSHSPSLDLRLSLRSDPSNRDETFPRNGDYDVINGHPVGPCEHSECDHECGDSDGTEDSIATTTATIICSLAQSVCSEFTAHTDCSDLQDFKSSSDHKRRTPGGLRDLLEPSFDMFALEDCPAPSAAAMLLQVAEPTVYSASVRIMTWSCAFRREIFDSSGDAVLSVSIIVFGVVGEGGSKMASALGAHVGQPSGCSSLLSLSLPLHYP